MGFLDGGYQRFVMQDIVFEFPPMRYQGTGIPLQEEFRMGAMGETLEMALGMQVGFSLQRHFSHVPTGKVGKAYIMIFRVYRNTVNFVHFYPNPFIATFLYQHFAG